eukprot:gene8064-9920_t
MRLWTIALQSRFELSSQISNPDKWIFVMESGGLKYWKGDAPNETTHVSKTEIIVNKSVATVMNFMSDLSKLHYWNKYMSSCTKICDLIPNKSIFQEGILLHGSPHLWLPFRDTCIVKYSGPHPNIPNTYVRVIKSVETPLCPVLPEYLRTTVLSGYTVEPISENHSRVTNIINHDFKAGGGGAGLDNKWDSWLVPFVVKMNSWTINKMEKLKYYISEEPQYQGPEVQAQAAKKLRYSASSKKKKGSNGAEIGFSSLSDQPGSNKNFENFIVFKSEDFTMGSNLKKKSNQQLLDLPATYGITPNDSDVKYPSLEHQRQIDFSDPKLFAKDTKKKVEQLLNFISNHNFEAIMEQSGIKIEFLKVQSSKSYIFIYKSKFLTQSSPSSILFNLLDTDKRKSWCPFITEANELWEKQNMAAMDIKYNWKYWSEGSETTIPLNYRLRVSQNFITPQEEKGNNHSNGKSSSSSETLMVTMEERDNGDILLVRQNHQTISREIELIYFINLTSWNWINSVFITPQLQKEKQKQFENYYFNFEFFDSMIYQESSRFKDTIDEEWWKFYKTTQSSSSSNNNNNQQQQPHQQPPQHPPTSSSSNFFYNQPPPPPPSQSVYYQQHHPSPQPTPPLPSGHHQYHQHHNNHHHHPNHIIQQPSSSPLSLHPIQSNIFSNPRHLPSPNTIINTVISTQSPPPLPPPSTSKSSLLHSLKPI